MKRPWNAETDEPAGARDQPTNPNFDILNFTILPLPEFVHYDENDRMAVLTIDNPPIKWAVAVTRGPVSDNEVLAA